ncbi:hypothetical protein ACFX2B_043746 [Malus domestica]
MESLCLLLVNSSVLISLMPNVFKFIQLELPMNSSGIKVHVECFDSPRRLVLQFYGKMAWFAIDERNGDMPMGVLYAVRYAHNASSKRKL